MLLGLICILRGFVKLHFPASDRSLIKAAVKTNFKNLTRVLHALECTQLVGAEAAATVLNSLGMHGPDDLCKEALLLQASAE